MASRTMMLTMLSETTPFSLLRKGAICDYYLTTLCPVKRDNHANVHISSYYFYRLLINRRNPGSVIVPKKQLPRNSSIVRCARETIRWCYRSFDFWFKCADVVKEEIHSTISQESYRR